MNHTEAPLSQAEQYAYWRGKKYNEWTSARLAGAVKDPGRAARRLEPQYQAALTAASESGERL